ncbi:NAD kinase [invertebrate metagenome]|uniref:NAD kinase n=1 Tax=invertebrate metagenome TaxID=1711999 RepID=A0A2H9T568_9ZZZZ
MLLSNITSVVARIMEQFKRVGITGRKGRVQAVSVLEQLIRFLQSQGVHLILDKAIQDLLPDCKAEYCTRRMMGECCDLVIVVGGDGSFLGAGRDLCVSDVPVIGVNQGRLGFLTDIFPDDLEIILQEVLEGKYLVENRFLLQTSVRRKGKVIGEGSALNDVVLHPGRSTRIIEFELYIDGQFVYRQRSDGLVIATPTGSTAYALSGGGPIMHPKLDAFVLVPMFPHMLTNRPLVVDGESELKLVILQQHNKIDPQISCDGQTHVATLPGDEICIRKKSDRLKMLHPLNHNFYEACRSKLRWNYQGSHQ